MVCSQSPKGEKIAVKTLFHAKRDMDIQLNGIFICIYHRVTVSLFLLLFIQLQNAHKRLLRNLYISNLAHPLFAFLLLFKKLSLS